MPCCVGTAANASREKEMHINAQDHGTWQCNFRAARHPFPVLFCLVSNVLVATNREYTPRVTTMFIIHEFCQKMSTYTKCAPPLSKASSIHIPSHSACPRPACWRKRMARQPARLKPSERESLRMFKNSKHDTISHHVATTDASTDARQMFPGFPRIVYG